MEISGGSVRGCGCCIREWCGVYTYIDRGNLICIPFNGNMKIAKEKSQISRELVDTLGCVHADGTRGGIKRDMGSGWHGVARGLGRRRVRGRNSRTDVSGSARLERWVVDSIFFHCRDSNRNSFSCRYYRKGRVGFR